MSSNVGGLVISGAVVDRVVDVVVGSDEAGKAETVDKGTDNEGREREGLGNGLPAKTSVGI